MTDQYDDSDIQVDLPWKDPDNPWKINRKGYREPDGYEVVEYTTLLVRMSYLESMITLLLARGSTEEDRLPLVIEADKTVQMIEEFWANLKKEDNE